MDNYIAVTSMSAVDAVCSYEIALLIDEDGYSLGFGGSLEDPGLPSANLTSSLHTVHHLL